jgi:hypothetical protein
MARPQDHGEKGGLVFGNSVLERPDAECATVRLASAGCVVVLLTARQRVRRRRAFS